ncbi:sensor histidine kinase [Nocardioides sp. MAHUQ-72]|uniref:sensor histidine kinase n=1 Tax=unclassified Nocardioides TaxID=2615069 RepID=UPI00360F5E1C
MSAERPVARLVTPVIVRVGVVVGLMALIALAGVVLSTRSVDHLTDELQPAAAANQAAQLDLNQMQAAVSAWSRSGQRSAVADYRTAAAPLPGHEREVRAFAEGDEELARLVAEQERAGRAWITQYAEPRLRAPGGPGTYQPARFRRGLELFARADSAREDTAAAFDRRISEAGTDASYRLQGTVLAIVLLALAAWSVIARSRRRLLHELSTPLLALEAAVQRMARNEPDVRAPVDGPKEVRAVAVALNDLADAQSRAREVENRIQDELRTLDTARDDFVSNVSHELRTPLTTISGYLEMVAEEFEDRLDPRHERMLDATRRNVSRLKQLIDDLLTLSRAEARPPEMECVDVVAVVRDAVTDVRITAARRGVKVRVEVPERPQVVLGDRVMLHRAFLNVFANAVKFSREGGVVDIEVADSSDLVEVRVSDRGIGIPAAELDRLGSRFFRASNAVVNEIAGTGLGIRIVQTIVEKHGGEVVIDSQEGRGTTVVLRLRLAEHLPDVPQERLSTTES